jgi:DNA-binding transcriptional LysR family regulator
MDRVSSMMSFVKVVDNGGFAMAARQLNLSPSAVTTQIKSLEDRLGVRLLNRSTRSVSLTEAGRAYYERCIQILSEIEQADEAAQMLQSKPRGTLRLNVSMGVPAIIAPSIAEFTSLYPDVAVRLTATSRMVDLVEEGFDLAVRFLAIADSSLILRRVAVFRLVVCASPDYLAKHGRPEHPSDLSRHNCIVFYDASFGKDGKEWRFKEPRGDLFVRVSGNLETNSAEALRAAALLGQGLLLAPSILVASELKSGVLVPLLAEFLPEEYSLDALYPHRDHLPAKVRSFIDLIVRDCCDAMAYPAPTQRQKAALP